MKRAKKNRTLLQGSSYIERVASKFESIMPEVHRQVKVYEKKRKSGRLATPPANVPLFSE